MEIQKGQTVPLALGSHFLEEGPLWTSTIEGMNKTHPTGLTPSQQLWKAGIIIPMVQRSGLGRSDRGFSDCQEQVERELDPLFAFSTEPGAGFGHGSSGWRVFLSLQTLPVDKGAFQGNC